MSERTCTLPGCDRKHKGHGLCSTHLKRQRAGVPLDRPMPSPAKGETCTVDDCDRPVTAKGMCSLHWQRSRDGVPLDAPLKNRNDGKPCAIDGCDKPSRKRGWCPMHWERWKRHGDPLVTFVAVRGGCSVEGCDSPHKNHGFCHFHGRRAASGVPLDAPLRVVGVRMPCTADGCDQEAKGIGLCRLHWERRRYIDNPEPYKARTALRRQRVGKMSPEDREVSDAYRLAIADDPCAYCAEPDAAHTDHVFPLAKGGTNHWWNLARACQRCNLRKHAHCGTHWHLKRGTWLVPPRPVPALAEAS